MYISVAVTKLHKKFAVIGKWVYYCVIIWRQKNEEMEWEVILSVKIFSLNSVGLGTLFSLSCYYHVSILEDMHLS